MTAKKSTALGDIVYNHILNMILEGELPCGEKIPEQKIVEMLNISRTPVREAIRRLSGDGIINVYPNRYAEVITFTDQMIQDLGIIRVTMDCLSAQLAIQNGSNRNFSNLAQLAKDCEEANKKNNMRNRIQYDCDFHMLLVEISENELLIDIQKKLFLKTQLLQITKMEDLSSMLQNAQQHYTIVEAMIERNVEKAIRAIKEHLCSFYSLDISEFYQPIFRF